MVSAVHCAVPIKIEFTFSTGKPFVTLSSFTALINCAGVTGPDGATTVAFVVAVTVLVRVGMLGAVVCVTVRVGVVVFVGVIVRVNVMVGVGAFVFVIVTPGGKGVAVRVFVLVSVGVNVIKGIVFVDVGTVPVTVTVTVGVAVVVNSLVGVVVSVTVGGSETSGSGAFTCGRKGVMVGGNAVPGSMLKTVPRGAIAVSTTDGAIYTWHPCNPAPKARTAIITKVSRGLIL
jgi:hypothetical protein